MILSALKDLSEAEGLTQDPDYEEKDVTRIIELDADGKLLGLTDIRQPDSKGQPRAVKRRVPKIPGRTVAIIPQFLYDKSDYVFGIKQNKETKTWDPTDERIESTITLIHEAVSVTADFGLTAVYRFLINQKKRTDREKTLPDDFGNNEWFVFRLHGDNGLVSDRPVVREWWKGRRVQTEEARAICLVTGSPCVPVNKHDAIKKVPGGSTSGVAIVTFNSPAFESYGFDRNDNAPIGREAAEAYVRALNRLLDPAYPDPLNANQTLPRRSIRLNEDTAVLFWTADIKNEFADIFETVLSRPDPASIARLVDAPRTGRLPRLQDPTLFFSLTISGGQGRAVVRDWIAASVGEMTRRIARYFQDLQMAFPFENAPQPSVRELLRSIVLRGEDKNIPPNLASDFLQAILLDQSLPHTLLHAAIRRCNAEGPLSIRRESGKIDWNRSHLRMQVIKTVLRRLKKRPELSEVKPMLDEGNTQAAYVLGRLFAVLEHLQAAAQGQTNATIGDRFYGAASTSPVTVFSRLLALSKHHMAKLRKERPGQAVNLDKIKTAIVGLLPAEKFPAVMSMEEQGLFGIGYYHQRQALFMKKDEEQAVVKEA